MVIGCDGIWERTYNQEMIDFVRPKLAVGDKATPLSEICSAVCDKNLCVSMEDDDEFDGTGCDNMTVVIVRFKEELCADLKRAAGENDDDSAKKQRTGEN